MNRFFTLFLLAYLIPFEGFSQSMGYVNHTEVGLLVGEIIDHDKRVNFSFQSFNGVRPHPHHEIGFLIGWDTYPGFSLVPFALGWRGILKTGTRTSPYASMDIGYGSAWIGRRTRENQMESWYQGGLLISPAIGIRRKSKNGGHAFSWSLGFKKQNASFLEGRRSQGFAGSTIDSPLPPGFISLRKESYIFNSLFIKWGVVF